MQSKFKLISGLLLGLAGSTAFTMGQTIVDVSGAVITADTTWDSDTNDDGIIDQIYYMEDVVTVKHPSYTSFAAWDTAGRPKVTLTITPGTVIAGSGSGAGTSGSDVGSLLVTRAGKVEAGGTKARPIVFTSASQAEFLYGVDVDGDAFVNTFQPDPVSDGGEWGGVILLGSAQVNNVSGAANTGENDIEGFPAGATLDITYGGGLNPDNTDNSGTLRYVRIEFGGFEFDVDEEINGLTMGGVGACTDIEYVEVVGNTDDGFEWFGGTVNTKHLVSYANQDESFDIDEGHQGTHQFWFALMSTASDNGTEADGGNGDDKTLAPLTLAKVYNATYVGGGASGKLGTAAFRLKENHAGQYHNSIFTEFPEWLMRVDDADTVAQAGVNLKFENNIWGSFGLNGAGSGTATEGAAPGAASESALLAGAGNTATGTDPLFSAFTRTSGEVSSIDPRPSIAGPAYGNDVTPCGPCPVNYRGAFGTSNWATSWTYLDQNGYFVDSLVVPGISVVDVSGTDITADTTWNSDQNGDGVIDTIYFMEDIVTVKHPSYTSFGAWDGGGRQKVTLTIEPGTVIAGSGSGAGTSGSDVGSVLVTRAGRLDAQGTASQPIVFTSASQAEYLYGIDIDGDAFVNTFKPDPATDGGEWGGVILLGSSVVNNVSGAANTGENDIEGFPAGATLDITYGGGMSPVGDDDSGILRYVRIEFGGFEFDEDEEINGLTMGGVGSGTEIEFVEVVGNTDDGFEWFGGTVNTKHLVSFFNQDESFDIDEGHQGTHQFLFAVLSTNSDNGTEADGGNGDDKTLKPFTLSKIFNATYIGGGEAGKLGTSAFRLKENHAGQYHNSIFTEFPEWLMRVDDADTVGQQAAGTLAFENNIWGSFGLNAGGSGTDNEGAAPGSAAEDALLAGAGNTSTGSSVPFGLFARSGDEAAKMDPRPILGSSAWGTSATLSYGGLCAANYRGAFGTENWAKSWTYMSANGYFVSTFEVPKTINIVDVSGIAVTADTTWDSDQNDDGVVDTIYFMEDIVTVKHPSYTSFGAWDGAGRQKVTLTIEPGTVIAGSGSGAGTSGSDVGSVLVTRAGRLDAQGTANSPIVFTSASQAEFLYGCDIDGDSFVNTFKPDPVTDGGEWGGVILLGSAQVNNVSGAANTGENDIEGFPAGATLDITYGGGLTPDNTDDSGTLRFVRIEFGGFEFDEDEEINGLTMGGVGSDTEIEFVEVVGNTDDGFEWFGGTVSTNNLVSFANQDESFDIDEGHDASHQFLFALMSTNSDNGTEADGGNGDDKTLAPFTLAKLYNLTYVGGGAAGKLGTAAFRLKENHAGQYHNSIFTEFPEWLVRVDDADTVGQVGVNLYTTNSIWGSFGLNGAGSGTATEGAAPGAASELALLGQLGNTATGTDPELTILERTADEVSTIDPRPVLTGPAWGSTVLDGAPTAVSFRGAFGTENWAHTWTYLSNNGYFEPCFIEDQDIPLATVVVIDSGEIEIESIEVQSNGDVEITVVGDATGITVQQSNDAGNTDAFAAIPSTFVGSVITIDAADADPNGDGKDFYKLVK